MGGSDAYEPHLLVRAISSAGTLAGGLDAHRLCALSSPLTWSIDQPPPALGFGGRRGNSDIKHYPLSHLLRF